MMFSVKHFCITRHLYHSKNRNENKITWKKLFGKQYQSIFHFRKCIKYV